jgi:hypothetical protein
MNVYSWTKHQRDVPSSVRNEGDPLRVSISGEETKRSDRVSLRLTDDLADGIIAKQIIELAKAGERNPDLLCQGALAKLQGSLYGD